MRRFCLWLVGLMTLAYSVSADEGMWMLPYLQKINAVDMKEKGLKIDVSEIYNDNGNSLKDAIVIFGRGCTGEIVSPEGLLFTNHHCGYGPIQQLSSVEHDYLADGYWAMDRSEELPVPGLTVKFIRHIVDVTGDVLGSVPDIAQASERQKIVVENIKALRESFTKQYPGKLIQINEFYEGNQYFVFVIDEYTDIRFVGAPPASIGKFGGDTDNWMWPRHTGDFSIFRVYSAPDGSPAPYSKENVPYKAPSYLKVSLKGYRPGDFAMIMGFPGSTDRYMTSFEVDQVLNVTNPNRILVRGERQNILKADMASDPKIRIQYASKYASSSNYWKNSIGMNAALKKLKVKDKKELQEKNFLAWAAADPVRNEKYGHALDMIRLAIEKRTPAQSEMQFLTETIFTGVEIGSMVSSFRLSGVNPDSLRAAGKISQFAQKLYKDYNEATDRKVTLRMLALLREHVPAGHLPTFFAEVIDADFRGDLEAYVNYLYDNSVFANQTKFEAFLSDYDPKKLECDPANVLRTSAVNRLSELRDTLSVTVESFAEGKRLYVAGLMEMEPNVNHYPDANFTIRLTYGQVLPYSPADGIEYNYFTTLKGVIEKEDPSNPTEFTVPAKLKELYAEGNYGRYGEYPFVKKGRKLRADLSANPELHVAFLTNNDITGGNSGSPVLNADGELIGLAFDGNWEAMSGDIVFEPRLQRCINVDIRYVLFLIDRFGGAGYLLDEMTIVE